MEDSEHADVLIIGAVAGGGVAASRLIQGGVSVTCLEQGDWPDRTASDSAQRIFGFATGSTEGVGDDWPLSYDG